MLKQLHNVPALGPLLQRYNERTNAETMEMYVTTQLTTLSLVALRPEIDQAFAEWESYKHGRSKGLTPSQLRVVSLARLILGQQEQVFHGVTEEHPLSAEQEAVFYKIFSRAAKVHFSCSEKLFSATDRLSIVRLLLKFAPSKMGGVIIP